MALLDDLETVNKSSYECGISRILKKLEPKEAQALTKIIDDPETSATSLARVTMHNANVSPKKFQRAGNHRLSTTHLVEH